MWLSQPATNAFQEQVFSLGSWLDSNRLMQCQGAKTFEMRMLECITCDLQCSVTEAEKKILVQEHEDRKRSPIDILSIVQEIKQEDTVGAISPKISNPAFIDKDEESVVEVVLSPQLITMTNAMQSVIENEETNNENPQYKFVQDGVDEELDKETGVSVVNKDGKGAAQVLLEADGLGLPNELDDNFGFGEVGEEDDDNNDEDIDDDQSMIHALMKEIADIESGSEEVLSDGDKKAASKLGAKKKLVMSQKDLHCKSVSHINWEENEEDEEIIEVEDYDTEEEQEGDDDHDNDSGEDEENEEIEEDCMHSDKGRSPTTCSMSSSKGTKDSKRYAENKSMKRLLSDSKSGSATKKTKKKSSDYCMKEQEYMRVSKK